MRNEPYAPHAVAEEAPERQKRSELKAFLFLTIVMAPLVAGAIIGGYGLVVWIWQLFAGPPTG